MFDKVSEACPLTSSTVRTLPAQRRCHHIISKSLMRHLIDVRDALRCMVSDGTDLQPLESRLLVPRRVLRVVPRHLGVRCPVATMTQRSCCE